VSENACDSETDLLEFNLDTVWKTRLVRSLLSFIPKLAEESCSGGDRDDAQDVGRGSIGNWRNCKHKISRCCEMSANGHFSIGEEHTDCHAE
jgi:hypothetical protein